MVSAATLKRIKRYLVGTGMALLGLSFAMMALMLTGVFDLSEEFITGESTIHSVARVAITGCLLAAVGSQE